MSRKTIFSEQQDAALCASYGPCGAAWCARKLGFTVKQIYCRAKRLGLMGTNQAPRSGRGARSSVLSPQSSALSGLDHSALTKALGMSNPAPTLAGGTGITVRVIRRLT